MRFIRFLAIALLYFAFTKSSSAQLYPTIHRPAGLNWQQIKTPHFRIIYPKGEDSLAIRAAQILEDQYPAVSALTGGSLSNFPVVLNNFNDRSNGYVTPVNFKSEVELPPIKGKSLNPKSGTWLETVLPHELVHAVHSNVDVPYSFTGTIRLFSPDLARTFHFFPPSGMHEGLAVHYESSSGLPDAGRGNYTYFNNQFNANLGGDNVWSMGQTFQVPEHTLPYNRYYIAGFTFTDWLHKTYGEKVSERAIRFHYSHFYMGYGFALKQVTGKWPKQLYQDYNYVLRKKEEGRLAVYVSPQKEQEAIISIPYKGEIMRHPVWISENELLFYGSFYNARKGFYLANTDSKTVILKKESSVVGDYNYVFDPKTDQLLYSDYSPSLIYQTSFKADIFSLDLKKGTKKRLTIDARIFSPVLAGDRIIALQTYHSTARIVEVINPDSATVLAAFPHSIPVSIAVNPVHKNQLAVLVNKRGVQALWISTLDSLPQLFNKNPVLAFSNGSVHDPQWHPAGNKLLFTLDAYPAMNVFEYDVPSGEITQITQSLYNAFEASYSPDGSRIAYVTQKDNEQVIAILERKDFRNLKVSTETLLSGNALTAKLAQPLIGEDIDPGEQNWKRTTYKTDLSWLKPRVALPVYVTHDGVNEDEWGAAFLSTDVLESQSYYAEISGINERIYYNLNYTNKTFFPGIKLSASSEPDFGYINFEQYTQVENEYAISVPLSFTLRSNTRFSSFYISPEYSFSKTKLYTMANSPASDSYYSQTGSVYAQLNINILSLPRDVQPSSGLVLFSQFNRDLQTDFPEKQTALYAGLVTYLSPLRRYNQSLRIQLSALSQTNDNRIYSNKTIYPLGFPRSSFDADHNLGRISTRYSIPLTYPDNGGLLLPLYVSSLYLTAFHHTISDLNSSNLINGSRSIFGMGFHLRFKVSNLSFDFGLGWAYEPTRKTSHIIIGSF